MTDPLQERLSQEQNELVELLRELVELESPTPEKALVDRLGARLAAHIQEAGLLPRRIPRREVGDIWWTEWEGAGKGSLLLLCHIDTVWPQGSLRRMPFRQQAGRLYGPGIFDMKAGVAASLKIQQLLREGLLRPRRHLRFLYTTDEETGSQYSQEVIEEFARQAQVVLVPEPPLPGGALKTRRKGVACFWLRVTGRAAHAGLDPEKGINALLELAHQILAVQSLANASKGTTLNVTIARGGGRENVIPDQAEAYLDVRFRHPQEGERVQAALRALRPVLPGARLHVEGGVNRPPMVRTPASRSLFQKARRLALPLGIQLQEGESGGGSDGSFCAALGIPTLDGLGVEGDGAHAQHEHILLPSLVPRVALLARLVEGL